MSHSPDRKPQTMESRSHMLDMLAGMELPPAAALGAAASAPISMAAAGRTATVEDMFNLAAPEVDVVIAKLIPMLVAPSATPGAPPPPPSLPSNPIEICEAKEDGADADGGADAAAGEDGKAKAKDKTPASAKDACPEATSRGLILAVKIGRSKDLPMAARVDHPRMSSYHCEVYYHPLTLQLFLRDVSTNGTFLNGSLVRMEKGKLVELTGGEMLQFVNPAAPTNTSSGLAAGPLPSATYLLQRIKAAKDVDDDALEEELTCGITKCLLYKPVMALPCLHTFSGHALSQWVDAGNKTCPECRAPMSEVRPSHKVSNLLEQFLKAKAATITYFTADEKAAFDKSNTIPPTGKTIAGGYKRRNWDEEGYGEDEEDYDEDYDEDDEDNGAGPHGGRARGMAWVPSGLPFSFGMFNHAGNGFGPSMPPPSCPECAAPAPFDGYQCPPMVSHITCHMCKTPYPERPLCGVPQRCALCALPHCDMYFKAMSQQSATAAAAAGSSTTAASSSSTHPTGCKNTSAGSTYFRAIKDHKMTQLPASLFGGNVVEQSILSMFLSTGGCPTTHFHPAPALNTSNFDFNVGINNNNSGSNAVPVAQVWADCLAKFQSGVWVPDVTSVSGPLTPSTAVCEPCCGRVFGALLYHYRRAIDKDDLPPAILNRPNCWYGIHCRTQFHNTTHAQSYNHVCPQEKRKE